MRLERLEPQRPQRRGEPGALLEERRHVGRVGERGQRELRRERRDRRRGLARVQLVGDVASGERVADARAGKPERFENVRSTTTPSSISGSAVSPLYSK